MRCISLVSLVLVRASINRMRALARLLARLGLLFPPIARAVDSPLRFLRRSARDLRRPSPLPQPRAARDLRRLSLWLPPRAALSQALFIGLRFGFRREPPRFLGALFVGLGLRLHREPRFRHPIVVGFDLLRRRVAISPRASPSRDRPSSDRPAASASRLDPSRIACANLTPAAVLYFATYSIAEVCERSSGASFAACDFCVGFYPVCVPGKMFRLVGVTARTGEPCRAQRRAPLRQCLLCRGEPGSAAATCAGCRLIAASSSLPDPRRRLTSTPHTSNTNNPRDRALQALRLPASCSIRRAAGRICLRAASVCFALSRLPWASASVAAGAYARSASCHHRARVGVVDSRGTACDTLAPSSAGAAASAFHFALQPPIAPRSDRRRLIRRTDHARGMPIAIEDVYDDRVPRDRQLAIGIRQCRAASSC